MNHYDIVTGQLHARIRLGDFRIVPLRDSSEINSGQSMLREIQRAGDSRDVVCRYDGAENRGEMQNADATLFFELRNLGVRHGSVGSAEINGTGGHLLNS